MKRILIVFLCLVFVGLCFGQNKKQPTPVTKKDTAVTVQVLIKSIENQIKQTNTEMRSQEWYDNFNLYQQRLAYLQGRLDWLRTVKDSVVVLPKE